jgi:predicted CopG family antitoxin
MVEEKRNLITIAIDKANYRALQDLGKTGESFNTVVRRMLKQTSLSTKGSKND